MQGCFCAALLNFTNMKKKKKSKPTRELLDFMIYDMGYWEALDHYGIDEDAAELILLGKAEVAPARPGRFTDSSKKPEKPSISIHIKHLKRVIALNYQQLFIEAGAHISNVINSQSLSQYDVFAEALQQMLWNNRDFYYISDSQAMTYIRIRMKKALNHAARNLRRHNSKVSFVQKYVDPYAMPDFEVNRDIEILSIHEREIAELRSEGYSQQEISYMLDCDQKTISNRLKNIYQKLKTA